MPQIKPARKHILITGPHRSGTTWVGRTISQHQNVELIYEPFNKDFTGYNFEYEFEYWFEHVPTSKNFHEIEKIFDQYIPNKFLEYPIKICRETGYSLKTPLIFLKYFLLSASRPRYLLKDPIALLSAGWLYERYNLQVVCMIRKPLSFAGSLKVLNWDFDFSNFLEQEKLMETELSCFKDEIIRVQKNGDFIDRIGLLWNILNYVILQYQKKYPEWLYVQQEKLALKPVTEFRKIFTYLNLEFNDDIKKYIQQFTSEKNLDKTGTNRYLPRNAKKTLELWRERLTPEETERILKATEGIYKQIYKAD